MVIKKARRMRGSRTHGWGAGKKHRGAGHRGGRGKAGSGKRGQQKKTYYLAKGIQILGGRDRLKPKFESKNVINLWQLSKQIKNWESKKLLKKEKGLLVVNLKKFGYDKLLGSGEVKDLKGKVKVIVDEISAGAQKKLGLKSTPSGEGGKG